MRAASAARLGALFLGATLSSFSSLAIASPSYPAAVAGALDLPCEPACSLCHTRSTGGFGTVNTPFGLRVRMRESLECCSPGAVPGVLDALASADSDSDGDGAPDVEELMALTDPNDRADVDLACASPEEEGGGCSVARTRASLPGGALLLVLSVLAAVVAARVRGRRLA